MISQLDVLFEWVGIFYPPYLEISIEVIKKNMQSLIGELTMK